MSKKIDNLKEMEIWSDIHYLSTIINEALQRKKLNKTRRHPEKKLQAMSDAIIRLTFYFKEYSNNIKLCKQALSEYRLSKNRAIERARQAEQENEKIRKQNESFNI
jgi:hypothetical protein